VNPELSLVTVVVSLDGYAMMSAMEEWYTMEIMALDAGAARLRGATRNGEYYHDMMACDGSSKPEFVQVQVARCHKISSLESPKITGSHL
jgi:hypothetical protein